MRESISDRQSIVRRMSNVRTELVASIIPEIFQIHMKFRKIFLVLINGIELGR